MGEHCKEYGKQTVKRSVDSRTEMRGLRAGLANSPLRRLRYENGSQYLHTEHTTLTVNEACLRLSASV